ncbi:MAG TPA: lipase maturation factor family protein [Candidatus Sulfotelmatobacter sp.]|nr:lipase maturation factor family protein [Candidatus Sulfotelmatobacter sp.]
MGWRPALAIGWFFDPREGARVRLIPRWVFLRALGGIYFSAFFSLLFQIKGLIGPNGILPAGDYLKAVAQALGHWQRLWYAPTLLWWSSGNTMLTVLCWAGLVCSILLVLNLWPRGMLLACFVCFLSFVSAAQDFSGYQSDGMLLEAGFLSLFFAPGGLRPGLGQRSPPSGASLFLLLWEWFRIYFESGVVKILSGDPQWRNFTAMDEYYQNGPLPTWVGWYVQHLPHVFHSGTVYATLALEIGLVWMMFLPRRFRIICFFIVTLWQIGVILTANYTFLNYLVLILGVLLLDDRFVQGLMPANLRGRLSSACAAPTSAVEPAIHSPEVQEQRLWRGKIRSAWKHIKLVTSSLILFWIFYATTVLMLPNLSLPTLPVMALEPFRIANRYGLFAVMTRGRYEIEFQGSMNGQTWVAYSFRYKPQKLNERPRIYAPYQPRFDWNLWFASLGSWRDYPIVANTEVRLLANDADVLRLFAGNPFPDKPPRQIRVVLWQYWFTKLAEKRATGMWWRREEVGLYAPTLERSPDGEMQVVELPTVPPRP